MSAYMKKDKDATCDRNLKILVAEDHEMMRRGIRAIIDGMPGFEICAEVTTGTEAVEAALEFRPHIAILDVTMYDMNGIQAGRRIQENSPETEILIFTGHDSDGLVCHAVEAGAKSVIFKTDGKEKLESAIHALSKHDFYFTPRVLEILKASGAPVLKNAGEKTPELTNRERETVTMLASGYSNQETAEATGVSIKTVETHRAAIMRKLKLRSFADLVRYAVRHHFVPD